MTDDSRWKTIDSAPRDGRYILVTDGERLAAASPHEYTEPAMIGTDYSTLKLDPARFPSTLKPNPEAGKVRQGWSCVGCSGFTHEVEVRDYDGPVYFEPTHWQPLPDPPE